MADIRERGRTTPGWEMDLPIHPSAVGIARRAFTARFRSEMSMEHLRDGALLVSELVGLAFTSGPPIHTLRVTGQIWDGGVRLTVQDDGRGEGPAEDGSRVPTLREAGTPFAIVTALAEAFGERRVNGLTITWCELHRGDGPHPWPLIDGAAGAGSHGP